MFFIVFVVYSFVLNMILNYAVYSVYTMYTLYELRVIDNCSLYLVFSPDN